MGRFDYYTCTLCGSRVFAADNCGCTDDLICSCGKCEWSADHDEDITLTCDACGSQPFEETGYFVSFHKARRDHVSGLIKSGDFYRKSVTVGYFPGGRLHRMINTRKVTETRYREGLAKKWASDVHSPSTIAMYASFGVRPPLARGGSNG